MTSLVRYEDVHLEGVWGSMVSWLDKTFAESVTSHRKLLTIADDIEFLEQELYDIDRSIQTLTPSQEIAAHRLSLRLQDIEEKMFSMWQDPAVRRTALRALQGIYERYVGPISDSQRAEVVFEISRLFRNQDFGGFIESHRTERLARWAAPFNGFGCSLVVVEGPRWVHALYRHLVGESLRGESLRKHYVYENSSEWRRDNRTSHVVGDAVAKPDPEVLEMAHVLWAPEEDGSPYRLFAAAVRAAQRL